MKRKPTSGAIDSTTVNVVKEELEKKDGSKSSHFKPKDVERTIQQGITMSKDMSKVPAVLSLPSSFYEKVTVEKSDYVEWHNIYGVKSYNEMTGYVKGAFEYYQISKNIKYKFILKPYKGCFSSIPNFCFPPKTLRAVTDDNQLVHNSSTKSDFILDDGPKIIRGLSKSGDLMVYPKVENVKSLGETWSGKKNLLKKRFVSLYLEKDYYIIEIKKNKTTIEYLFLEHCTQIKQSNLFKQQTIELYINELIFVFVFESNKELNDWVKILSSATGLDVDLERSSDSIGSKRMTASTRNSVEAWDSHNLNQISDFISPKDENFLKNYRNGRVPLFDSYYDVMKNVLNMSDYKSSKSNECCSVLFSPLSLKFDFDISNKSLSCSIEPFYLQCFLYDIYSNEKISEDVTVSIDSVNLFNHMESRDEISIEKVIKLCKFPLESKKISRLLYNYTNLPENTYLIIIIHKVYDGSNFVDAYNKGEYKMAQKYHFNITTLLKSDINYLSQLGFCFVKLIKTSISKDSVTRESKNIEVLPVFRMDMKHNWKNIKEILQNEKKMKDSIISNGKLTVQLEKITNPQSIKQRINFNFEPVKGFDRLNTKDPLVLEPLLFNAQNSYIYEIPHNQIIHHVYINLISGHFNIFKPGFVVKNVVAEFRVKGKEDGEPLKIFYSKTGNATLCDKLCIPIYSKNMNPQFAWDIKFLLPINPPPSLHIHITFLEIYVKSVFKTQKKKPTKTILGYSYIPLFNQKNQFDIDREIFVKPLSNLSPTYLNSPKDCEIVYNERSQNDSFAKSALRLKLIYTSNICTFIDSINKIYKIYEDKNIEKMIPDLCKHFKIAHGVSVDIIKRNYPFMLQICVNILLSIAKTSNHGKQELIHIIVSFMLFIVQSINSSEYHTACSNFISDILEVNIDKDFFHDVIFDSLNIYYHMDPLKIDQILNYTWFIFKTTFKSIKTDFYNQPPYGIVSNVYKLASSTKEKIEKFFVHIMSSYSSKLSDDIHLVKKSNILIAKYLVRFLSILERDFVFGLLSFVLTSFKSMSSLKVDMHIFISDFIKILIQCPFILQVSLPWLNLVQRTRLDYFAKFSLSQKFYNDHFIIANLIEDVQKSFTETPKNKAQSLNLIINFILKIHFDDRIVKTQEVLGTVLSLFLPLVTVFIENVHLFSNSVFNEEQNMIGSNNSVNSKSNNDIVGSKGIINKSNSRSVSLQKSESLVIQAHSKQPSGSNYVNQQNNEKKFVKEILLIFLYILQNINKNILAEYWKILPKLNVKRPMSVQNRVDVLYGGERQAAKFGNVLDFFYLIEASIQSFKFERSNTIKGEILKEGLSTSTLFIRGQHGRKPVNNTYSSSVPSDSINMECLLSEESIIVILETINFFKTSQKIVLDTDSGNNPIKKIIMGIYIKLLETDLTEFIGKSLMANLRLHIQTNSMFIFRENNQFCERLCEVLFLKLPIVSEGMRNEIICFIYQLLRANYFFVGLPFQRTYLGLICASSQVMNDEITCKFILKAVNTWLRFVKQDAVKISEFSNELFDLGRRIQSILKVGKVLILYADDQERSVDILYNLSRTFSETPELLINWFEKISESHKKNKNFSEAAMCTLYSISIITQILNKSGVFKSDFFDIFGMISKNFVIEKFNMKIKAVETTQVELDLLYKKVSECADFLISAERYEALECLLKCITSSLEERKCYNELSNLYTKLSESYSKLSHLQVNDTRNFAAYYRVSFYGKGFKEECGKHYIYKEPPYTPLPSIKQRLEDIYKTNVEKLEIVLESNKEVVKNFQLDKNYIQINSVKIDERLDQKVSEYEKNSDVKKFYLETPFTKQGKNIGCVEDQYIKVTTFYTFYTMPFVKKRINILYTTNSELSPIQVAISEMNKQILQLELVTSLVPPDMKRLQLKLQGSVNVTVNSGPLAYAEAFLNPAKRGNYKLELTMQLEENFKHFIEACQNAVQLNSELIESDQFIYHNDLLENFNQLKQKIEKYLPEETEV